MKTASYHRAILLVIGILAGCDSTTDPGPPHTGASGVFILNEGAFQAGNAELSYYDPETGTVTGNLYSTANPGATLGDVANSMSYHEGRLYVAVNNSGRVDVLNAVTRVSLGRILLPGLPRSIAVTSSNKAYVTLQDSTVAVVNPGNFTYIRSITVGQFPEGIVYAGGRVFVMNSGFGWGSTISVIDPAADSVVAEITTPHGPSYAAPGPAGRVYVVCTGGTDYTNPANDTPGAILAIDPVTVQIVDSLSVAGHPGKFTINSGGTMFLLGPGTFPATPVWALSVVPSLSVVSTSLVQGSYYGIGHHEGRRELLLADAGTFTTNGTVHVVTYEGVQKAVLRSGVGIAPNSFLVPGNDIWN